MCSYFRVFFRSLFYIFGFMNPCAGIATLAYVWSLQEVSQTSILLSREYVRVGGLACCAFCQEFYLPAVHSTSFSSQSSSNNCIKYLPFFLLPIKHFYTNYFPVPMQVKAVTNFHYMNCHFCFHHAWKNMQATFITQTSVDFK